MHNDVMTAFRKGIRSNVKTLVYSCTDYIAAGEINVLKDHESQGIMSLKHCIKEEL